MFVYYLNIPLNQTGVEEFESYDDEMPNVHTVELSASEYQLLRRSNGLFSMFDQEFGIFIDVCEEERIELSQLDQAIEMTEKKMKKSRDELETEAINKVLQSLQVAKESATFWEIDIYLE